MGIRASYFVTGGIMTVLGLAFAKLLGAILATLGASLGAAIGGVLLAAALFAFKTFLVLLGVGLLLFFLRRRRRPNDA